MRLKALLLVLAASTSATAKEPQTPNARAEHLSMVAVLADPARFDGKTITISGFFVAGQEYTHSLFFDENSFDSELFNNSLSIPYSLEHMENLLSYSCSYVLVTGKFSSKQDGFGIGVFESIDRVLRIKTSETCLRKTGDELPGEAPNNSFKPKPLRGSA